MKSTLLILLSFVGSQLVSQGQTGETFKLSEYAQRTLLIADPKLTPQLSQSFSRIRIEDARYDTSIIGFTSKNYFSVKSLSRNLERYFNAGFTPKEVDTANTLIIFIKKIWVTHQLKFQNGAWAGGIIWKTECFYKIKNNFFPIIRFDTTFTSKVTSIAEDSPKLIDTCLKINIQKIADWNLQNKHILPPQMTSAGLDSYKKTFFNAPILKDSILHKGIFLTFEEFKSNSPKYTSYEFKSGKLTDALYIKDSNGEAQFIRNVWGFCDGSNLFIKSSEKFFKLTRSNNTFYLKGAKDITRNVSRNIMRSRVFQLFIPADDDTPTKSVNYHLYYYPYQLDMDDGSMF